ncbi:hypothetical protein HRH25_03305 [Flavisolibacter sp. BT320]|nr:hypothetical protein [Flavisolibacter longurius]
MRTLFLLFLFLLTQPGWSQQDVLQKADVLPQSPEAAAFGKNINIPVNYVSGTPQIGIPFCTVKSGSVEAPIAISYNASGIRVEETPTWVGLGWSLNAGGQITRTVRDKPDEKGLYGYMIAPANRRVRYVDSAHCRCMSNTGVTGAIDQDIANGLLDLEPDEYNFSVAGYSGKFFWHQDSAKFILVPFQNIWIGGSFGNFMLTLPNGVKCYFGETNTAKENLLSGTTASYIDGVSYAPTAIDANYATSWMLTTLQDPAGRSVRFNYIHEAIITFGRGGERYGQSLTESLSSMRRQSFYKQYIQKPVLESIKGDNLHVYFRRSSLRRQDMVDYQDGSRSLDTLIVKTPGNQELKSFLFKYGYFISSLYSAANMLNISMHGEEARKRLYLQSITEKTSTDSLPAYEFTYNGTELPSRLSSSQDYWGYYNGKTNGPYMMPRNPGAPFNIFDPGGYERNKILPGYGFNFSLGSDRRVDTVYSQARILTKIKYPTGGTIEYSYEQNNASTTYLNIYGGVEPPDMVERSYTLSLLSNPLPAQPPYPLSFTGSFHINIPATKVRIVPTMPSPCGVYNDPACKFTINLRSLPSNTLLHTITTTPAVSMQLSSGDYLLEVLVNGSTNDYPPSFNVQVQWGERLDSLSFLVGGVRIKKIVSRDGIRGTISRSFSYKDPTGRSSGILEGIPTFKVHELNKQLQPIRQYFVSNSVLPLSEEGRTVRYENVSEFLDSTASSHKTEYAFTSGLSEPPKFAGTYTGAPVINWNWQHGLLKRKKQFEKIAGSGYRLLTDEQHFYLAYNPLIHLQGLYGPQIIKYQLANEWYLPDSTSTTTYAYPDGQTVALQTGAKTFYNNHFLPFLTRTNNSKGQRVHSKIWYPTDFNDVPGFNVQALYSKHIWQLPIKQETSVNGKVTAASVTKYSLMGMPIESYAYENAVLADTAVHNRSTVLTNAFKLRTSLHYDALSNPKQVNNYRSGPVTYIWHNEVDGAQTLIYRRPIASVINADSISVAYTSFENAKGNWVYTGSPTTNSIAIMGSKVYSLSTGTIGKAGLSSTATYVVSYWSPSQQSVSNTASVIVGMTTANGWTYYEHKVVNPASGAVNVSGTGLIDELRLYPEKAQMTTYSYTDRNEMNAQCDANNKILYYEYDGLSRLSLVRDPNKNILKKYCYNYVGQVENCGGSVAPQWTLVNSYCEQTSDQNTGNMVMVYSDSNPNSGSYGQTQNTIVPNSSQCPLPSGCNLVTCSGPDKKCINGVCQTGVKVCTATTGTKGNYITTYHYEWNDGSRSPDYQESGLCLIM